MKKLFILIVLTLIIFNPIVSQADLLDNLIPDIIKSINEETKHWGINCLYLYRCPDPDDILDMSFPDVSKRTDIVIRYDIFNEEPYIVIKKPIDKKIEGEQAEDLMIIIKTILYNKLKRELKINEITIVQEPETETSNPKIESNKKL